MMKHPVVVNNPAQGKGPRSYGPSPTQRVEGLGEKGLEGTATRDLQERNFIMDERRISQLFKSYFNNKMTLLLFLIQAKSLKPNPKLVGTVCDFLDDLFHHMLEGRTQQRYRLIFEWLMRFFKRLPDVTVYQRDKAKDFIRAIYDAFGLHLKSGI